METTTHNNKLSFAEQKMNIKHCFAPVYKTSKRGACCSALLLSILLSILQIIISTSFKRRRVHYPRGEDGLSLITQRLILYQKNIKRRKRRKVGLNSPPRPSPEQHFRLFLFSPKKMVENILCCLKTERWCL